MPKFDQAISQQARADIRALCSRSPNFLSLGQSEQYSLYRDLCNARATEISVAQMLGTQARQPGGLVRQMAGQTGDVGQASDLIDDSRHNSQRFDEAGDAAAGFINSIDFPQFVADLLKAVFDANLKVTLDQMDKYMELMKAASQSISKFVNEIDDTAAFGYLAENNEEFSFDFGDETDEEGNQVANLTDDSGNVIASSGEDIGDNEVKSRIMDAKINMAREQRGLLREAIYMGLVRLVVDKGTVKASVQFDISVDENITKTDKAGHRVSSSSGGGAKVSGGLLGKLIGGVSGGGSNSNKTSSLSVSTVNSVTDSNVSASLAGSVEIQFSSDYFKLDNFAALLEGTAADTSSPTTDDLG